MLSSRYNMPSLGCTLGLGHNMCLPWIRARGWRKPAEAAGNTLPNTGNYSLAAPQDHRSHSFPEASFLCFFFQFPSIEVHWAANLLALLSQHGTGAIKQPPELSSSAPSAAPKPRPILGSAAGDLGHTAWKTPTTPLSGHIPALTPSHCREQMAVHVCVPTLPTSLSACCLPAA